MNFIKTAFRYLMRDKVFSYINVLGLAVGLTAVLCIAVFVVCELNYDNFHINGDRIYRASVAMSGNGIEMDGPEFTPPLGPAMHSEIPEIELYTRISKNKTFVLLADDNKSFKLDGVCYADTTFFEMFTFSLLRGNPQTALSTPFSIVLTEEWAQRIFGDNDPIGQILRSDMNQFTVTGVVKSPPRNSHLVFNALASFSTLYRLPNVSLGWNGGNQYHTYVRFDKNADHKTVVSKMQHIIYENLGRETEQRGWKTTGNLRSLRSLHLYHDHESLLIRIGLYVFSALGLIILAVACVNFVNLTTARSMRRVKEASMRRVLGAKRGSLVIQFLGESILIAMAAFIISLFLFAFFHPLYIQLTGGMPGADLIAIAIVLVFVLAVITGVLGGAFPAIRLTAIDISNAFKGGGAPKSKRRLQSTLIVMQFASAVFLIICTIAATSQLSLMKNIDLGFQKDGILVLKFNGTATADKSEILKQRLQTLAEFKSVTATTGIPCGGVAKNGYKPEGRDDVVLINVLDVDKDFLEVYEINLIKGRFFSGGEQDKHFYIVNETLAKTFGWNETAIGKYIERDGNHEIIGVVSDFIYAKVNEKIEPLIITNAPHADRFSSLSIKYSATNIPAMLLKVETIWNEVNPDAPLEYSFFDEIYNLQYKGEEFFRNLFAVFATIAIVLAVLGVMSLMAYTTEQRKKEIGIRKVLGASVKEILALLFKMTGIQILVANLLAWPLAWWVVQMVLNMFAYRISLGPVIFIIAFMISACAALFAVGFQAMKAATSNPLDAIKTE